MKSTLTFWVCLLTVPAMAGIGCGRTAVNHEDGEGHLAIASDSLKVQVDGTPVSITVVAMNSDGEPGQGEVVLIASAGSFAEGKNAMTLSLQNGRGVTSYTCAASVDPFCARSAVELAASWKAQVADLELVTVKTTSPSVADAGTIDAGVVDAGVLDAGVVDAGVPDAGELDAGAIDAGVVDAGVVDAGMLDAGVLDAGCDFNCQAASLANLSWLLPCGNSIRFDVCEDADVQSISATFAGAVGTTYDVVLHFQGVVELKDYVGGSSDGMYWQVGGQPASDDSDFNVLRLDVSDPAGTYFVNRYPGGVPKTGRCYMIDYQATIQANAGATITLSVDPGDGAELKNTDGSQPISVPGVASPPQPYDGQFVNLDVVSISAHP